MALVSLLHNGYTNGGRLETVNYKQCCNNKLKLQYKWSAEDSRNTKKAQMFLRTFGYSYDLNGNITNETRDSISYSFDYDTMNRLTNVLGSDNLAETYEYDPAGNRTKTDSKRSGYKLQLQ